MTLTGETPCALLTITFPAALSNRVVERTQERVGTGMITNMEEVTSRGGPVSKSKTSPSSIRTMERYL